MKMWFKELMTFTPCQTITAGSHKAKHLNYEISILYDKMTHQDMTFT